MHAFRMLGMLHNRTMHDRGERATVASTFAFAAQSVQETTEMFDKIARLSSAEQRKLFGFDPNEVTPEEYQEMIRQFTEGMPHYTPEDK